jgi:hypothetical protein
VIAEEIELLRREIASKTRSLIMMRFGELQPELCQEMEMELADLLRSWRLSLWKMTRAYEGGLDEERTPPLRTYRVGEGIL